MSRLTRGRFLAAGALGASAALGGLGIDRALSGGDAAREAVVPFHGEHQAGIATPAQERLHFAAFDLADGGRTELRELLRAWTDAAARMCAGEPVGETSDRLRPPIDTGEAVGLRPARLTLTFGFGPSLFERVGLPRPGALRPLPAFPGDELETERCDGDLAVQACADDPQVAFHAVRNLARIGRGQVAMRWSQLGFGRTSSTSRAQETPRNLMGFKDGTNNLKLEDEESLARHVWAAEPEWLRGGTYMVTRRIRMLIEVWDRASLDDQERTIGRRKASGAPLSKTAEFEPVELTAIPADAHVKLAAPAENSGTRILRRGYSFTDGMDTELGQLDAGLFFVSFQRDPADFVRLQQRLAEADALNEYIKHTGSALFAVPRGVRPGGYVGDALI